MSDPTIHGHVEPGFERVRDAFAANFAEGREDGASFAATLEGRPVVDLWAGTADPATGQPWERDTLVNVWSTTKGLASLCVAMVVDRGLLRYDQPVAEVWPAFGAAGKQDLTVAEVLSHQGGLSGPVEPCTFRDLARHDHMAALLAAQAPLFPVGQCGYHALTHGVLTGELVRRADGRSLGRFFAEEVARPLGVDAWIGLPASEDARVARLVAPPAGQGLPLPKHPVVRAALANPPLDREVAHERWWKEGEIPAVNAQANARALTRIYAMLACGGSLEGRSYLTPETLAEATRVRIHARDIVLGIPMRWAAGFSRNDGVTYGPDRATFGHSGWGGSFACADPTLRLSAAYAMNRMVANLRGDPRALSLLEALYGALGVASRARRHSTATGNESK